MGLRGTFFLSFFAFALVASLFAPVWGMLAYLGHYYLWPEQQWWGKILAASGIRVSLTIAAVAAVSILLHWNRLWKRRGRELLHSQEILLLAYVAIVGLSTLWGLASDPQYARPVHAFEKVAKVTIFLLMLGCVVTTTADLRKVLLFIVTIGGVYLAWVAYTLPSSHFVDGRLEGVGGPDLTDSNFLATHFVVMGILTGVMLLTTHNPLIRVAWLGGGALIANAFVLTRSRGAFVAAAFAGLAAIFLADRSIRRHLAWLVPLVAIGGLAVTDARFWDRVETIFVEQGERDTSASSRLELWGGAIDMFADNPMGVGADNFFAYIGHYRSHLRGRDTHNTYFRCLAETGLLGLGVLLALFVNGFRVLARCRRRLRGRRDTRWLQQTTFGLQLALVAFASGGLTITMTYTEELFLFFALPVCVDRTTRNLLARQPAATAVRRRPVARGVPVRPAKERAERPSSGVRT